MSERSPDWLLDLVMSPEAIEAVRKQEQLIKEFGRRLADAQRPLDPEAARVLRENLWELYE